MGDIARCSIDNEDLLYKLFGVNAELLIDHAWGWEPCTMESIKSYKPSTSSISSGQVLHSPYTYDKAKLIVREMMDSLSLELVEKDMVTNQLVLTIGYDIECLTNPNISKYYDGVVTEDFYGRRVPKPAHGTITLEYKTSSSSKLTEYITKLYEKIVNKHLLIRRINISVNNIVSAKDNINEKIVHQIDLFTDYTRLEEERKEEIKKEEEEKKVQNVILDIKKKYGKNAILKGMNLEEGATACKRNAQSGGHRA